MLTNSPQDNAQKLAVARVDYPSLWQRMIEEWHAQTGDMAWLTYAANYILVTAGVRWALDPFSLSTRIDGVIKPNFTQDLNKLELVILSHAHNDHLDLNLIQDLVDLPIKWVVPDHMMTQILEMTPLRIDQIIVPVNGTPIQFRNLYITPFNSLHFHDHGGIPETGYLVEFSNKKWLFPGDIRNFDITCLPLFGSLSGVFAHLWLGKGKALEAIPPELDSFCTFFNDLSPKRLVITHLNEFGREASELWSEQHFALVKQKMGSINPSVISEMALMGSQVKL
jgi:hypothetical protein